MADRKDILLDESGNFATVNGDFVTGKADDQNIGLLLVANKGEIKEYPTIGVGIVDFINDDSGSADLEKAISENLKADGYKLNEFGLINGKPTMDYERC